MSNIVISLSFRGELEGGGGGGGVRVSKNGVLSASRAFEGVYTLKGYTF